MDTKCVTCVSNISVSSTVQFNVRTIVTFPTWRKLDFPLQSTSLFYLTRNCVTLLQQQTNQITEIFLHKSQFRGRVNTSTYKLPCI